MIIRAFIFFLLGTIFGSFLNCCLYRLAQKIPLWGRSFCPFCRKQLYVRDLIPIFSYLWLQGKCRFCKKLIGWQSFNIELVTGFIFVLFFIKYGVSSWLLVRDLFLILILMFILIFDWRHYVILDKVVWPALGMSCLLNICLGKNWLELIFAGLIGGGFFLLQYLLSGGKWIGLGDVKLGILLGAMLGWQFTILTIILAYLIGGVTAIALLLSKRKKIGDVLPLGSFLAGAGIIVLLAADILQTYLNIYG